MFRKSSIFTKIFIPVMAIMLLQVVIINIFLFAGGTIDTLNRNAIDVLAKNAQNRSMNLEHLMVNYWSNINHLERDVSERINEFVSEQGIEITELLGDSRREIDLLYDLSPILIDSLRLTASTGIFIYFLDGDDITQFALSETQRSLNGLYLRNLSPLSPHLQTVDRSGNLMVVRGHVNIARRHNLPLDSLWEEVFHFSPEYEDLWSSFANPQIAAAQFPGVSSVDLSYWSRPHLLNPWSPRDMNMQITYTRPLIIDGRLVAIIGTEMQLSHIELYFPARDLDNFRESGFMLIRSEGDGRVADVFGVTGGFMNRLFAHSPLITLTETQDADVFSAQEHPETRLVLAPIRIYNLNAPFANERWALAAVSTENSLFEMSANVSWAFAYSTAAAFIIGFALIFIAVRKFSKPIGLITKQIQSSSGNAILPNSKTYEIDLLCQTINDMIMRRDMIELHIRNERQQYLHALAGTADLFVEYDPIDDFVLIHYFEEKSQKEPSVRIIREFSKLVNSGKFYHDNSKRITPDMFSLSDGLDWDAKIQAEFFEHIQSEPYDGYFWFSVKSIAIYDTDGTMIKIVSTAKEITRKKLEEIAVAEASRRDITTGLYNRSYGLGFAKSGEFELALVRVRGFDKLEIAYGKIFGGIFIAELARAITGILEEPDLAIRFGNSEFLLLCQRRENGVYNEALNAAFCSLYAGEQANVELSLDIKAIDLEAARDYPKNPVTVSLDMSDKDKITDLALELLERSLYINSSIRAIIGLIGRLFALDAVIICFYDANFSTNQVTHQWVSSTSDLVSDKIMKVSQSEYERLKSLLDENGTMIYTAENKERLDTLLCITDTSVSTYCCTLYDNAVDVGRALFVSSKPKEWLDSERLILQNITKIISTYINADKSRSASRAKSMFLSRISHEIRTPMNVIIGMVNIALASAQKPEQLQDSLRKISTSSNYLLSLINDVLEISRVESGYSPQMEEAPLCLDKLVREIDDLMRVTIEERGITFEVVAEFAHTNVVGDQQRLKQVLINLLSNAYKFTTPGGAIVLKITEDAPEHYVFSVRDNGIGIPFDKQLSIFDPFEQASPMPYSGDSSDRQQGTGLGLAITKNILLAMNSKIELNSTPDAGSEFYFKLYLRFSEHDGVKEQADDVDYADYFSGKRALLVDDIQLNIEVAAFVLEGVGFLVESATNGQEALEMFLAAPEGYYDFIIMDIQMPVMDGIEATRRLRNSKLPHAKSIPIIAMTANAFDDDLKRYIGSGMDGCITKPLQIDEMMELLKNL